MKKILKSLTTSKLEVSLFTGEASVAIIGYLLFHYGHYILAAIVLLPMLAFNMYYTGLED